jgi:hypothetical protein
VGLRSYQPTGYAPGGTSIEPSRRRPSSMTGEVTSSAGMRTVVGRLAGSWWTTATGCAAAAAARAGGSAGSSTGAATTRCTGAAVEEGASTRTPVPAAARTTEAADQARTARGVRRRVE